MVDLIGPCIYDATSRHMVEERVYQGGAMIDLEKALRFPTTDREWKRKVLIGGLLNIVPVINFL